MKNGANEVYNLLVPFFRRIEIILPEEGRNQTKFLLKDISDPKMGKNESDINVYIYEEGEKPLIYSFGDRNHLYLSSEFSNLFEFYLELIEYLKLIHGFGNERKYKY